MSSTNKKRLFFNTVAVDLGCGSCWKPSLSNVFHPKPKSSTANYYNHHLYYTNSSSSSKTNPSPPGYDEPTTSSFSPTTDTPPPLFREKHSKSSRKVRGLGRVGGESVAVEKDSDDPYLDFRHSMLQMILEKEIYSKDDLKELLNCFLQLNSPYYHGIIVRAFTEIWNGVYSVKSSSAAVAGGGSLSQSPMTVHYYYGG